MSEISQIKIALDDVKEQDHVIDVSLVSRSGMFVMGESPKGVHKETLAAMSAVIFGAAETTTNEMGDKLNRITIELADRNLILIGIGPKYIVAIVMDQNADSRKIMAIAKDAAIKIEQAI